MRDPAQQQAVIEMLSTLKGMETKSADLIRMVRGMEKKLKELLNT